ncbi:MAG TPA: histidine kinase dimerization/phospho-acceptor domain-containing protein [Candidatus Sulfotelmatobacter sp.]|nr:histidine kinase dimerization/phospho-acceptor domain-containing protein [Candidatus Sulfotelmatobacter sp.]
MADSGADVIRKLRHDLANPLAAILAETQLLLLNEAQLDAETLEGLREIEALARRMREMLQATTPAG